MAITFDGSNRLMILTTGTVVLDVRDLYSRWKDWVLAGNAQYPVAFSPVGGEDIDIAAGTEVPFYCFLINGWRVRPQEASHTLKVTNGILLVDGGGDPFVDTLSPYTVRINYQQPVQAITVATGGGGGATAQDVWEYPTRTLTANTGTGMVTPFEYKAKTNTQAEGDPGSGYLAWNHVTQNLATELYIDMTTNNGLSLDTFLDVVPAGTGLYLQDKDDATRYQRWVVLQSVHATGYHKLLVSLVESAGGNLPNNHTIVLVFNGVGVGIEVPTAQENADAVWAKVLP